MNLPSLRLGATLLLSAIFSVSLLLPAFAQDVTASKIWYGVYRVGSKTEIKDSKSPTGFRYENTGVIPPKINTSEIELREEIYFGFGYVVTGSGEIEEWYFLPDARTGAPANIRAEPQYKQPRRVVSGQEYFIGWYTGGDATKTAAGEWTLQVRFRGRAIAEHNFIARRDAPTRGDAPARGGR